METTHAPIVPTLLPAETRKHHPYSPSKMNYLDACAAFESRYETNDAAEQGTFLHDLMEQMIQGVIKKKFLTTMEQVDKWLTKTHELTEDEIGYIRFCCKRSDAFISRKPTAIYTEIKVHVTSEAGKELNSGYLDVLYIFNDVGIGQDFKFGWEPVKPASTNLQGINYVLGVFQKYQQLNRIGWEFVQPKINLVTSHVFERREMSELYDRLNGVVERALAVKARPEDAQQFMKPGSYCGYCARSATCAVLANHRAIAASKWKMMPVPVSFSGLELSKPEDLALARYWIDVVEQGFDGLKEKAFQVAEANGGSLRCTLPTGEEIVYEVMERSANRSLGSAVEVAEALKDIITPQEVLAAAELAITKLEPIAKNSMVELAKGRGEKLTKKAAWEQITGTLESQGLLTRPDNKIRFLKLKKQAPKEIEQTTKETV